MFEVKTYNPITSETKLIYSPILAQKTYVLNKVLLSEEVNKAASLSMIVPNINANKGFLTALKPEVKVYRDSKRIFRGRVISSSTDFLQTREIKCEGELAYLRDAVLRPDETHTGTVAAYFAYMVGRYNAKVDAYKRFRVGSVTVTGETKKRSNDQYPDFLSELTEKLLNEYGGAFRVRCVVQNGAEVNYIDYLQDAGGTGAAGDETDGKQTIRFAKNLLEIVAEENATPTFTALVPLGALENKARLTIKSVNGGADYLENATATAKYGRIEAVKTYDTIKDAAALKTAGQADLAKATGVTASLEVKAVDLFIVNEAEEPLIVGKKYRVLTAPNVPAITEKVRLNRAEIDLLSSNKSVYTFGSVKVGITQESVTVKRAASAVAQVAIIAQDQATQVETRVAALESTVDDIEDFIVESQQSGGWKWNVYNSGKVELYGSAISVTWGTWTTVGGLNVSTGTVRLPTTVTGSYAILCSGSDVFLSVYSKTGTTIVLTAYSTGTPTDSSVDFIIKN